MKKLQYKDIYKRNKEGKVTIHGVEYDSIHEVPDEILELTCEEVLKEYGRIREIAKPIKVIENIGWAFMYVSAGTAIASWILDGQAQEVCKTLNMVTLFASSPEFTTAGAYQIARLKKINKLDKIFEEVETEQRDREIQAINARFAKADDVDVKIRREGRGVFVDIDITPSQGHEKDDVIEGTDFRVIE